MYSWLSRNEGWVWRSVGEAPFRAWRKVGIWTGRGRDSVTARLEGKTSPVTETRCCHRGSDSVEAPVYVLTCEAGTFFTKRRQPNRTTLCRRHSRSKFLFWKHSLPFPDGETDVNNAFDLPVEGRLFRWSGSCQERSNLQSSTSGVVVSMNRKEEKTTKKRD